jgi:hypothetical protein
VRSFEIIGGLKIQPEPGAGVEVAGEAQSCVGRNASAFVDNLGHSRYWDSKIERQTVHAEAQRLHEFGAENLAGVDGRQKS